MRPPRKPRAPVPFVECPECLKSLTAHPEKHRSTPLHRNGFRAHLKRLLAADPKLKFTDLAARFHLSKQRIHQLVTSSGGPTGRERSFIRHEAIAREGMEHNLRFDFIPKLRRKGFKIEPVIRVNGAGYPHVLRKQLEINGRLCAVLQTSAPPSLRKYFGRGRVKLIPFNTRVNTNTAIEFVLYRIHPRAHVKGWLVVPAAVAPSYSLVVMLGDVDPKYESRRAGWKKYVNAWDLIKKVRTGARFDPAMGGTIDDRIKRSPVGEIPAVVTAGDGDPAQSEDGLGPE